MDELIISEYKNIDMEELSQLYESVGWSNYTNNLQMLQKAYENSLKILSARKNGKLAGIIRAVGDGCSILYIQDLLVRKEYQNMGIGSSLVEELYQEYNDVYQIVLLTDNQPETAAFYKKMGFIDSNAIGCTAFIKLERYE